MPRNYSESILPRKLTAGQIVMKFKQINYVILPMLYHSCVITCRRALRDTRGPWCTLPTSTASV